MFIAKYLIKYIIRIICRRFLKYRKEQRTQSLQTIAQTFGMILRNKKKVTKLKISLAQNKLITKDQHNHTLEITKFKSHT